ncbi:MAG TPA: hypothetical protein PLU58_08525 [Saprospiraceae bacterium]|jgi:hypothetical protein|nr:hypothetical protein [Saprospiraceae bacterium]
MKSLNLTQIEVIATVYGAAFFDDGSENGLPSIEWEQGDYGFYATEQYEGKYYGWVYFGSYANQSLRHVMQCYNALTYFIEAGEYLTIDRAHKLRGEKIEVSYSDVNNGKERFKIVGMEERPSDSIGQTKEFVLHTIPIDEKGIELQQHYETWCYEWQGIFRRGSGAERLYIDKIYD